MRVTVIGAGIVGLLSAYYLARAGHKVGVIDAGPNPLLDYDRRNCGATYSGADARHVSATETSPHASSSMQGAIYKSVSDGGWLAKNPNLLNENERGWMRAFDNLTQNPNLFNEFTKTVVAVNNRGKDLWRKLMDVDPGLFKATDVKGPIIVFFLDEPTFKSETAVETIANPDFPPKVLTQEEIEKYPVKKGSLAGGLVLDGFALHAISFCKNVINHLEREGVDFTWDKKVTDLENFDNKSDFYLISTGVGVSKKVMGVVGVWIKIPNPGFSAPFKIVAPYPTGYINATLDGDSLLLSGGYGFIGKDIGDEKSPGIQTLLEDLKRNIKAAFPESYERALRENSLDERVCVRPMKASGLGIFEVSGKLIFAGANSAGGFTQAPVVAEAVLELIEGKTPNLLRDYSAA